MSGIAYCGIDFGVDCCTVALCNDAFPAKYDGPPSEAPPPLLTRPTPSVVVNELGTRSTPTWIQCPQNNKDTFVVGATARDQAQRCEKRTVSAIKLALGHATADAQVQEAVKNKVWTCDVVETKAEAGEQGTVGFSVIEPRATDPEKTKRTFSATSLAASVLKQLLGDASSTSGKDVKGCVLAVHPNATDKENAALVSAAKMAGFEEIAMLTSDVAAALAYGFDKVTASVETQQQQQGETKVAANDGSDNEDNEEEEEVAIINSPAKRILVLDVGARSATASLLLSTNGLMQTVHTLTEEGVGGWYIDETLVSLCASQFKRTSGGVDVTQSDKAMSKLRNACQTAKQALSTAKDTMLGVEALHEGADFQFRLNVARFEAECGGAMMATLNVMTKLLQDMKLRPEDIQEAVLAGGSARIPKLRRGFYESLGREDPTADVGTINSVDPAEAVALGVAIHAAQCFLRTKSLKVPVQNNGGGDPMAAPATPCGISVETEGGVALELVPRNAVLPLTMSFYATSNDDGSFALTLLGGSKPLAQDNLTMLELCQQTDASVASKDVKVDISIDVENVLKASATFVNYDEEGTEVMVGKRLEGMCKMVAGRGGSLDEADVLLVGLRDAVAEYDSAMLLCVSKEEVEDLEEEDVTKIQTLVRQCRDALSADVQPIAQWSGNVSKISEKMEWLKNARSEYEKVLNEIMADYLEDGEEDEEDNVGGDDSDMD
jgi:molecular chaperone DnaK (HSP70)